MTWAYVAIGEFMVIGFLLVVHFAVLQVLKSQNRARDRREDMLINQIMHLSGKTWTPPPAEEPLEAAVVVPDYLPLPEQEEE